VADAIDLIFQILADSSVDAKSAEVGLLQPDTFGKLSISLDEMMPDVSTDGSNPS
jgi:hypothetical protein